MTKFVLDADGAIKLARSGALTTLTENAKVVIPDAVFNEIIQGKEKQYEDAFIIEALVNSEKIRRVHVSSEHDDTLGIGEIVVLALWKSAKADAVISDDRKFIRLLEQENIPVLIPTLAIVWLVKNRIAKKEQGKMWLQAIRPFVRIDAYDRALVLLGGE